MNTLWDIILQGMRLWPDNKALIEADRDREVTYIALHQMVEEVSGYIASLGLSKTDRVGILSENSIEYVSVFFALSKLGCICVPLNCGLGVGELIEQARDCSLSALYISRKFLNKAKKICEKVKSIHHLIKDGQILPFKGAAKPQHLSRYEPAIIIYTSGSFKKPRGVTLSHYNLISNNKSIVKYTGIKSLESICCVLPFFYIYGLSLLLSHLMVGGCLVIENRFMYPGIVLNTIERYRITGFAGVPSHYSILLYYRRLDKSRLRSLRYFLQAGDAMSPNISRWITKRFPEKRLFIMYGLTEASPRLTYLDPSLVAIKPTSVGKPIPGVKVRVVDKDGRECRPFQRGEIIARGANIMLGYWRDKEQTKKVLRDGWLYTGDLGFKDKDGDLYITGRKDAVVKIAGQKVDLFEIQNIARSERGVLDAVAVAVKDNVRGRIIHLYIVPTPGSSAHKERLLSIFRKRLPPVLIPSRIIIRKSLPKTQLGKIDRARLLRRFCIR